MSLAVCCLAAFMGLQAFCYAGFHAYVQVSNISLAHSTNNLYNQAKAECTSPQPNRNGPCLMYFLPLGSSGTAVRVQCLKRSSFSLHAALPAWQSSLPQRYILPGLLEH